MSSEFLKLHAAIFERKTVNPFHAICHLTKGDNEVQNLRELIPGESL